MTSSWMRYDVFAGANELKIFTYKLGTRKIIQLEGGRRAELQDLLLHRNSGLPTDFICYSTEYCLHLRDKTWFESVMIISGVDFENDC